MELKVRVQHLSIWPSCSHLRTEPVGKICIAKARIENSLEARISFHQNVILCEATLDQTLCHQSPVGAEVDGQIKGRQMRLNVFETAEDIPMLLDINGKSTTNPMVCWPYLLVRHIGKVRWSRPLRARLGHSRQHGLVAFRRCAKGLCVTAWQGSKREMKTKSVSSICSLIPCQGKMRWVQPRLLQTHVTQGVRRVGWRCEVTLVHRLHHPF
mmetsp:Transcript_112272/g.194634  ORF Transcript_112272/g.194634 Transcript_112272/m.194634 type:complete len:212 (-) Transcript_112272:422-1057(-)